MLCTSIEALYKIFQSFFSERVSKHRIVHKSENEHQENGFADLNLLQKPFALFKLVV